jgi:SPP1 gp7 family putative phage head morphogenesis protein
LAKKLPDQDKKKTQTTKPLQKTTGLKSSPRSKITQEEQQHGKEKDIQENKEDQENYEEEIAPPSDEDQLPTEPAAKPKAEAVQNLIEGLYFGTAEKTEQESAYDISSMYKPYNPDDLYQKSGDYSIYEDMLKDDQVSVCMHIKKDLVIGSGWDIITSVDDEQHAAIKKDLEQALGEDPDSMSSIDDMLEELLSSYEFGFSLSEKLFKNRPDGSLTLNTLKTRHPSTWLIHTDKHGNVEKYEQRGRSSNLDINPKSLIHYINNPKFQNPYGTSDLRAAYNAWFIKRQIVRYYGIFLEKAASPTPVAKYDTSAPQEAITAIYDAIKKFQSKTALVIPKAIEIEFLETKSEGQVYTRGINIFNMFIGRSLLIPDLLGFQGEETSGGSYSLGKHQMEVLFKHIQRRRTTLERLVNKHLICPIVVYNHGFVENYPKFRLRPISDEVLIELAKLWLEAMKGHIYEPNEEEINHFRKLAKFPEGSVKVPEPVLPTEPDPSIQTDKEEGDIPTHDEDPIEEEKEEQPKEDAGTGGKQEPDETDPSTGQESREPGNSPKETELKKEYKKAYAHPGGEYYKKVDFKAIENHMESFKDAVLTESTPLVKRIFEDLFDQIEQKKIVKDQKPERIDSIKIKYLKDLKLILKRNLREAFVASKKMAQKELMKGVFRTPLPDDKFLDVLEAETFQFVGDWAYNVTKKSRVAMMEAIRDGKPLSSLIDLLDDQGIAESLVSLERFSRTKFTDVTNRGRLAFFNESGVVAAYQYSAILDDRTSPICDGLHGKIFKAGTEPVPPMHFNCRSVLIPITKYEDFEADEKIGSKSIDDFILQNKGDGFSKR